MLQILILEQVKVSHIRDATHNGHVAIAVVVDQRISDLRFFTLLVIDHERDVGVVHLQTCQSYNNGDPENEAADEKAQRHLCQSPAKFAEDAEKSDASSRFLAFVVLTLCHQFELTRDLLT